MLYFYLFVDLLYVYARYVKVLIKRSFMDRKNDTQYLDFVQFYFLHLTLLCKFGFCLCFIVCFDKEFKRKEKNLQKKT